MEKLDWKNLKNFACPKCGEDLCQNVANVGFYECSNGQSCDFRIGKEKFRSMTAGFYVLPTRADNLQIGEDEFLH